MNKILLLFLFIGSIGMATAVHSAEVLVWGSNNWGDPWLLDDLDDDNDGMPDLWEQANGLDQYNSADAYSDADGDELIAIREYLRSADPNLIDTDSDGIPDSEDFFPMDIGQWKLTVDGPYKGLESNSNNQSAP